MRPCTLVLAAAVVAWDVPQRRDREPDLDNPLEKNRAAIEPGRELFASSCGGCHGPAGQVEEAAQTPVSVVVNWQARVGK